MLSRPRPLVWDSGKSLAIAKTPVTVDRCGTLLQWFWVHRWFWKILLSELLRILGCVHPRRCVFVACFYFTKLVCNRCHGHKGSVPFARKSPVASKIATCLDRLCESVCLSLLNLRMGGSTTPGFVHEQEENQVHSDQWQPGLKATMSRLCSRS